MATHTAPIERTVITVGSAKFFIILIVATAVIVSAVVGTYFKASGRLDMLEETAVKVSDFDEWERIHMEGPHPGAMTAADISAEFSKMRTEYHDKIVGNLIKLTAEIKHVNDDVKEMKADQHSLRAQQMETAQTIMKIYQEVANNP